MKKRRDPLSFFANPFVVLADIMVCLTVIISLFLLSTTIYSEEAERFAVMQNKRENMAKSLVGQLSARGFPSKRVQISDNKYVVGDVLEVESDGSLQRFRFLKHRLDFRRNSAEFRDPFAAQRILKVLASTLLQNRSSIKSVVIEGHAGRDESRPWERAQLRAEIVRQFWEANDFMGRIAWEKPLEIVNLLRRTHHWDDKQFHEWHREEYQARRDTHNGGLGVFPEAWVISSGRGDSTRAEPTIEFKVEYTERDAPPLDEYLLGLLDRLPIDQRDAARKLIDPRVVAKSNLKER